MLKDTVKKCFDPSMSAGSGYLESNPTPSLCIITVTLAPSPLSEMYIVYIFKRYKLNNIY